MSALLVQKACLSFFFQLIIDTLPKTNSSHLKIGHPKRKQSYSNHPFSGAKWLLVSGSRVVASMVHMHLPMVGPGESTVVSRVFGPWDSMT